MKYENLGKEYLVLQDPNDKKKVLALRCGELVYYYNNIEVKSWIDSEDIYPLTIQLLNEKDPSKRDKLEEKIRNSLTYKTFEMLCEQKEYN